ncbi:Glycylpeptide N-tetradecanoyltransferase 1 [Apostasia shenzhenica]|uniref:Glycylpeptide N-tetradecanoyltransferase n=1 Tax=Apostasia shenzhenica TaxID=1088818 RepID=A0A2I0B3L6_9ASPA|nr:Glycylpeptide N-tetradecanoyltransferase 1 [Apostasia shenzhenica]
MADSGEPSVSLAATSVGGNGSTSIAIPSSSTPKLALTWPTGKHPFWETQPVMQLKDAGDVNLPEGPIVQPTPGPDIKQEPYNLPAEYEWAAVDVEDGRSFEALHGFIDSNFESNRDFSSIYSEDYLRWVLCSPGFIKSLHVGVCTKKSKKLVGFIAGAPARLRIKAKILRVAAVNLLCVHRKLRSKRLVPVLARELARRAQLEGIWQAVFATSVHVPTPFAAGRWLTRFLDPKTMVDLGFMQLKPGMTMSRAMKMSRVLERPATVGFRKMQAGDVPSVAEILNGYLRDGFPVSPEVDEAFVEHFLVPKEGRVESFVVAAPETGEITDFCSFLVQRKAAHNHPKHKEVKYATLFYYAASKTPLVKLIRDLLVVAKQEGCVVFKAQSIMGNDSFLDKLLFRGTPGSRPVYYYLYNYRLKKGLKAAGIGLMLL